MKTFKTFLREAYDFKPSSDNEIRKNKNIPKDWHQFIIDLNNDPALKDNIIFQTKWEKGDVKGDMLAVKIKPGTWAELQNGDIKIGSKFDVKMGSSSIKIDRQYGEDIYSISAKAGSGSGSKKPSGAQWESLITVAYNGGPSKDKRTYKEIESFWGDYGGIAMKISKWLESNTSLKGTMVQFGATTGDLTKEWSGWGGSNKTPKTDMYTSKSNISLKKKGGSQLMSARGAETVATFFGAMGHMGEASPKSIKKLTNIIMDEKKGFPKMVMDGTIDDLQKGTGSFADLTPKALKQKQQELEKKEQINKDLSKLIDGFFQKNKEFQEYFVWEASSGYAKFGKGSQSVANKIMVFDAETGTKNVFEDLGDSPTSISKYIKGYAGRTKFYVSFKSSGKNPAGVLRTKTVKQVRESIDYNYLDVLRETLEEDEIGSGILTEANEQLDEFALLKKAWDKAKTGVKKTGKEVKRVADFYKKQVVKGYEWLSNFMKKYLAKVNMILDKMVTLGKNALRAILNFFGIVPSSVDFSEPGF